MSKLPTAEETILKTLLLKSHLERAGCYNEVIEAMHTFASLVLDEAAKRIYDNEEDLVWCSRDGDGTIRSEKFDLLIIQLKNELTQ